jgi:thiol peroxidase
MRFKTAFKGKPLTLVGRSISTNSIAPSCRVTSLDMAEVILPDFSDKIKVISSFPSLDTEVCDLQVKEFNRRATALTSDVVILGISQDLPFAQKRFCESFSIQNIHLFSDYKTSSYGINYGLLIKELHLLARAVVIVDKTDYIRYIQVGQELTKPLDYEDIMKNIEEIIKKPTLSLPKEKRPSHCIPCAGKVLPLSKEKIEPLFAALSDWQLIEDKKIVKEYVFADFVEAKYFFDLVAVVAEEQGHHPNITIIYNKVKITLTTHSVGGLTENDFVMAHILDNLG